MKKEEIYFPDFQRLFLGNTPWEFMLEVAIRTLVIYVVLLVVMRLLGKRMGAQMTIAEMAIMITLGAIVSLPMQDPQRGVVHGIMVLVLVVLFQAGLGRLTFSRKKIDDVVYGRMILLVKNGIINVKAMKKSSISHEQLYSQLRCTKKIRHLGEVDRVYLEACGLFSIFKNNTPRPGLSIIPADDESFHQTECIEKEHYACMNCGFIQIAKTKPEHQCQECHEEKWIEAVSTKQSSKEQATARQHKELEVDKI